MPVTGSEAKKHLKNITKKYFAGATVDFTKQSSKVRAKAPFVRLTLGSPARDSYPTQRMVDDRLVSYYQTRLPVQIDLFTNGADGEAGENGFVETEDTSVDDLTDFVDYLESWYVTDWCHRIGAAIIVNGAVQPLTGLVTDTDYEYRAMVEIVFCYVHKAVGYTGIQGEASIQHPSETAPENPEKPGEPGQPGEPSVTPAPKGDGSEPGYVVPDDTEEGVTVKPVYELTASGGGSQELVENTETGYFGKVNIEYKKEEGKQ